MYVSIEINQYLYSRRLDGTKCSWLERSRAPNGSSFIVKVLKVRSVDGGVVRELDGFIKEVMVRRHQRSRRVEPSSVEDGGCAGSICDSRMRKIVQILCGARMSHRSKLEVAVLEVLATYHEPERLHSKA